MLGPHFTSHDLVAKLPWTLDLSSVFPLSSGYFREMSSLFSLQKLRLSFTQTTISKPTVSLWVVEHQNGDGLQPQM